MQKTNLSSAAICMILASGSVLAEPASIKLGDSDFIPQVRIFGARNSNAFRTDSGAITGDEFGLSPRFTWIADKGRTAIKLNYIGTYASSSYDELQYLDHDLGLDFSSEINKRSTFKADASVIADHYEIGTEFFNVNQTERRDLITYTDSNVNLTYLYGAKNALGNLGLGFRFSNRTYSNNADLTNGYDFTVFNPYAQFSYRVSDRSRAYVRLGWSSIEYDNDVKNRNDLELTTGLNWEITGRSTGSFAVGLNRYSFINQNASDGTKAILNAKFSYSLKEYSVLDFNVERYVSNLGDSFLQSSSDAAITSIGTVGWTHKWTSKVTQVSSFQASIVDRSCPSPSAENSTLGLSVDYAARRWLSFGVAAASSQQKNSYCAGQESSDTNTTNQKVTVFVDISL